MKKITNIVSTIFIALLLCVVGVFLFSLAPIQGNIKIKIVKSGSMEPAIKTGSIVIVKPSANYMAGDVITFGKDTKTSIPTTHRIVSIRQDGDTSIYTTKGDANEEADPEETNGDLIIGKAILSVRYAGYILDFAKQPIGFILIIVIPAIIIVIYEVLAIIEEIKNRSGQKNRESEQIYPKI